MAVGIVTLVITDVVLVAIACVLIRLERWQNLRSVPLSDALLACLGALLVYTVACAPLARECALTPHFVVLISAFAFLPSVAYGYILLCALTRSSVDVVFGLDTGKPAARGFSKAQTLVMQDDVEGAIKQYREYFEDNPKDPEPLFECAELLIEEKRFRESGNLFREVMQRFEKDDAVWGRAALRLAELYRDHMSKKELAVGVLTDVTCRMPRSGHGRRAYLLLDQLRDSEEGRSG